MRVAVTGPAGHLGANLVRALLARGDDVAAVVRKSADGIEGLAVDQVKGDVRDLDSLRAAFDGCEVVFHLAAVVSITGDQGGLVHAVNVEGARNAAIAARDAGVKRFIHTSSVYAFDMDVGGVVDEKSARANHSATAYDKSKYASELAVHEASGDMDVMVVYPSGVIGPHDFGPSPLGEILQFAGRWGIPFILAGGSDWVDVRDVAAGFIAAAEKGKDGEGYILGGRYLPLNQLFKLVTREAGTTSPLLTFPHFSAFGAVPPAWLWSKVSGSPAKITRESLRVLNCPSRLSHAKAARDLDYVARPIEQTIVDTVAWFADPGRK